MHQACLLNATPAEKQVAICAGLHEPPSGDLEKQMLLYLLLQSGRDIRARELHQKGPQTTPFS